MISVGVISDGNSSECWLFLPYETGISRYVTKCDGGAARGPGGGRVAVDGAVGAALVDIATGMVVQSAGEQDTDFSAAAASMAKEARAARAALGPGRTGGDLEEITVITAARLHICRILDTRPGEGILLFVDLDRVRINIALATLRVGQLAPAVLA